MTLKSFLGWGLETGLSAPDFSLMSADGKPYTLHEYRGKKVLLYFYPQASTPGCTAQACSFQDEYQTLKSLGYVLLGVSTDSVPALQRFVQEHRLSFPMLSDVTKKVCKSYQVLLPIGKPNRVTFLISEEGLIEKTIRWDTSARSVLKKIASH